jgi:sec-independent protein translocase protein TatA
MGSFSIWHWLIVLVVVLILFGGRGKISQIMGDFANGLRTFKRNIKEEEIPEQPAGVVGETKVLRSGTDSPTIEHVSGQDRAAKS